jgi:asparagine synthase (glutamine-hydrolysing)
MYARAVGPSTTGASVRHTDPDDHWSVGCSSLGTVDAPMESAGGESTTVLFRGDLLNEASLRAELNEPNAHRDAVLAGLYDREGLDCLDRLDGTFAIAIIDRRNGRIAIASDALGSHPVYWRQDPEGLIFGSELRAVIRALDQRPALSMKAVADFVTVGFVLGRKTLAAGIELLDPGTVLTYEWPTGALSRRKYFDPLSLFRGPRPDKDQYLVSVTESFQRAAAGALSGSHTFGVSLSGGLDSRAVLCAAGGRTAGLMSYTVGVPGCADQAIAAQLSRIAGTRHEFLELHEGYLRDFETRQARLVELTDGLYVSHGLTEMLVLEFLQQTGVEVLLRGHGGELAKTSLAWPLHTDARIYRMTDQSEFIAYLSGRANYVTPGLPLANLFSSDAADMAGPGAAASMTHLLESVTVSPPELCSYLYLREHHRRFTVPSLELFRQAVEVRLPFMDRSFLTALLSAPPEWRDDTSLHRAFCRLGDPALIHVRNSNTGAPGDAGPLTEMLLDKVNTVLKRLNEPGYRHYHNFEAWLRKRLLQNVEDQLLTAESRVGLFVRSDALSTVIEQTRRGTHDYSYLLQILLIIELWLRRHDVDQVAE